MLVERRRGTRAELAFLADVRSGLFTLLETTSADLDRITELVTTYADLPLGTVDASVIALAERLGLPAVATLDHVGISARRPAGRSGNWTDAPARAVTRRPSGGVR